MPLFKIEVREVLSRVVEIEAEDLETAIEKVEEQCNESEIVLDSDDFISRDVEELEQD